MKFFQTLVETYRFHASAGGFPKAMRRATVTGGSPLLGMNMMDTQNIPTDHVGTNGIVLRNSNQRQKDEGATASTLYIRDTLEDINTQRMLFDARQAATFAEMGELPPLGALEKIRTPFPVMYLEFTEPILIGEWEPESHHRDENGSIVKFEASQDYVRAMLITENVNDDAIFAHPLIGKWQDIAGEHRPLANVTFLLTDGTEDSFVDRTFKVDLQKGKALVLPQTCVISPDPSYIPESYLGKYEAGIGLFEAGQELLGENLEGMFRYVGWWERITQQYTEFLSWVLMYMMAKGISVVQQPMNKKESKRFRRKNIPVQPWHVIVVEPQFSRTGGAGIEEGRRHSYRYDVMGHLRFGNHHVKDSEGHWSMKRTVEWVSPHQRGVSNTRYVPAMRHYKSGKETHPAFREYMEGGDKND